MCFGGGQKSAPQSTIYMPATDDYDRQFEMQKMLLENQMKNNAMLMQQQLASALDRKRNLMDRITQSQIEKAQAPAAVEEEAQQRIEIIQGPVQNLIPQPSAGDIKMGRERGASRESDVDRQRGGAKKSGKGGLRIARNAPKSSAGVGLNIS